MLGNNIGGGYRSIGHDIIIGCVDNAAARSAILKSVGFNNWWIDAGNGHHSGQVLIGNIPRMESMKDILTDNIVRALPAPSMQLPELLVPVPAPVKPRDCAEAVANEEQSQVINQAMAALVLEFVSKLLAGKLSWMAAYIDLELGTMNAISIDVRSLSQVTGLDPKKLIGKARRSK